MKDLINRFDPSLWSEVSGIIFGLAFIAVIFWVCLPQRKVAYDKFSRLPLE